MTPLIHDQERCTRGGHRHNWVSAAGLIGTCMDCGAVQHDVQRCRVGGCSEPIQIHGVGGNAHALCEEHWGKAWDAEWDRRQLALRKRAAFWIGFAIGAFAMCVVVAVVMMVGGER